MSLGPPGSGKSCLIKRFCENRFVSKYITTIGVDYGVKPHSFNGKNLKVNFWDMSGHPEFYEVRNEFYKDTQGAVMVFDVTDADSFDDLGNWVTEAKKFGLKNVPICVCANKVDMRRVVSEDEARDWAQSQGFAYFETSAQTGANVQEVFEYLMAEILKAVQRAR